MSREIKNFPASIHALLRNAAEDSKVPFSAILQHFALERFLYRISQSEYKENFVLRGGLMFAGWGINLRRPTRDIDLLGYTQYTIDSLERITREICDHPVEPDGLDFDSESIQGEQIMEEREYHGVRIKFKGYLGEARIDMQIDFGFNDQITPNAIDIEYPTLLEFSPPILSGYPYVTVIAEKIHGIFKHGEANTRMKDFYDIWLLSHEVALDGKILSTAILNTFKNRDTEVSHNLSEAFSEQWTIDQEIQWKAFITNSHLDEKEFPNFTEITSEINIFINPVLLKTSQGKTLHARWDPTGYWK